MNNTALRWLLREINVSRPAGRPRKLNGPAERAALDAIQIARPPRVIAAQFGVSRRTVSRLKSRAARQRIPRATNQTPEVTA